jgi:signal peptidase I
MDMKTAAIHTLCDFEEKPALFSKKGGELHLSGPDLIKLLQAVLDKGVPFRFRAKGFSMSPFIKDNDVITVSPLTDDSTRSGDVVAFIRPEMKKLVIHRVVGKEGEYFHIKGDNITDTDELIPIANILGRVTRVERNGKKIFFGLGPERFLIAFLTRRGLLFPLLYPIWRMVRPIFRRTFS